ncbi:MAG: hypothetical protein Q8R28_14715, partial [Dehalococcoidia bacterium]|nr:hypothetical protein [Dehalococcoidia bacterium]
MTAPYHSKQRFSMSPREKEIYDLCLKVGKPGVTSRWRKTASRYVEVGASDLESHVSISRDSITRILRSLVDQNIATRVSRSPLRIIVPKPIQERASPAELGILLRQIQQIREEERVLEARYKEIVKKLSA